MTYRVKFLDGDYRRDPKTDHFCCMCQKDITGPHRMVHLVEGGDHVLHPEDEELFADDKEAQAGDLYWHPIGPSCAKRLGLEWSVPVAELCPHKGEYGEYLCKDGDLWALTHSEMGPPDSRQHHGSCPHCKRAEWREQQRSREDG